MNSAPRSCAATKPPERPGVAINFAARYALDDKAHRAFTDALDRPPPATKELRKLMEAKAPWQE